MWGVVTLGLLVVTVHAHSGNKQLENEGDLQTSLMPQELIPAFVSGKDEPWKTIMPLSRARRDLATPSEGFVGQLKRVSRVVACAVLAVSAAIEILLYVLDSYMA